MKSTNNRTTKNRHRSTKYKKPQELRTRAEKKR